MLPGAWSMAEHTTVKEHTWERSQFWSALPSDQEDCLIGHHDLIVLLHLVEGCINLGLGEGRVFVLLVHVGMHVVHLQ